MPRSLSPDSPLVLNPAAPSTAAVGGCVELQHLRSHVLALDALNSGSSSDEEPGDSALPPVAAAAVSPLQDAVPATWHRAEGGNPGLAVTDSTAEPVAGTAVLSDNGRADAFAGSDDVQPVPAAAEVIGLRSAAQAVDRQVAAGPPLIRHGAGALAGLLQTPEDAPAAQSSTSTAERYRQAMGGLLQPSVGCWSLGAGMRSEELADGIQLQQRWLLASGQQHQSTAATDLPPAKEPSRDGEKAVPAIEQPRPPTPPATAARRGGSGAAPSAGGMRPPPSPPSLPQVAKLVCNAQAHVLTSVTVPA